MSFITIDSEPCFNDWRVTRYDGRKAAATYHAFGTKK